MLTSIPINNNVMNPAIARQMFQKVERIKRQRLGTPASLESFPRIIKILSGLWRHSECQKYLEELIMVEGGGQRQGFPVEVQEELMFIYQLLLDQHSTLSLRGQNMTQHILPGTKFTMSS